MKCVRRAQSDIQPPHELLADSDVVRRQIHSPAGSSAPSVKVRERTLCGRGIEATNPMEA